MKKVWILGLCSLFCSLATLGWAAQENAPLTPPKQPSSGLTDSLKNYRNYTRLTAKPHLVNLNISISCMAPLPDTIQEARQKYGPHTQMAVHIYANPLAAKALKSGAKTLPVGSVIVKEKRSHYDYMAAKVPDHMDIGGMVKREAGYDPSHGDWEYFYRTAKGQLSFGRMNNCIACHSQVKQQDYLFKDWMSKVNDN